MRCATRFICSVLSVVVVALGLSGVGALTQSANATTATVPSAPLQVYVANEASTSRVVTWSAPVSDGGETITDYEIEYREVGSLTWVAVPHQPSASTSILIGNLSNAATYVARVRAINSEGFGPWNITGSRIDGGGAFACAVVDDGTMRIQAVRPLRKPLHEKVLGLLQQEFTSFLARASPTRDRLLRRHRLLGGTWHGSLLRHVGQRSDAVLVGHGSRESRSFIRFF